MQPYFSRVELRVLAMVALGREVPQEAREALRLLQVAGLVTKAKPPRLTPGGIERLLSFL